MTRRTLWRGLMWAVWGVLALLLVAPLVSREIRFVYRGGWELARIQLRARPIADVLADPATDSTTRANLELGMAARQFAVDSLQLDAGESFTRFTDVGRDTLVLVLTASLHDTLSAYTWWFPLTGRVTYHGYYSRSKAERAARRLEARGYDTYLRPAGAFSTLGWLPDPLLSTSLYGTPGMAATVMHELAHNTVWFPGETQFSESLASLIGYRGAEALFRARGELGVATWLAFGWDRLRAESRIQERLVADLRAAFASERGPRERDSLRTAAFAVADSALRAQGLSGSHALRTAIDEHNNAAVIAAGLYHGDLDGLEAAYQSCGANIARLIQRAIDVRRAGAAEARASALQCGDPE